MMFLELADLMSALPIEDEVIEIMMTPQQRDLIVEALSIVGTERKAHQVMSSGEYAARPIIGWHEVCRDVDGFGGVGIRFLSLTQGIGK